MQHHRNIYWLYRGVLSTAILFSTSAGHRNVCTGVRSGGDWSAHVKMETSIAIIEAFSLANLSATGKFQGTTYMGDGKTAHLGDGAREIILQLLLEAPPRSSRGFRLSRQRGYLLGHRESCHSDRRGSHPWRTRRRPRSGGRRLRRCHRRGRRSQTLRRPGHRRSFPRRRCSRRRPWFRPPQRGPGSHRSCRRRRHRRRHSRRLPPHLGPRQDRWGRPGRARVRASCGLRRRLCA